MNSLNISYQHKNSNEVERLGIPLRECSVHYNACGRKINELRYLIECFPIFDLNGHAIIHLSHSHVVF